MTAKQFFKSKAFKCIATLLAILLVCGILLTVCNALFYVSDEEKLGRAISKIYGQSVEYVEEKVDDSVELSTSEVQEVYKITTFEGDYLLKVKGLEGYSGGTVTCWIRTNVKEGASVIKITIDSNVNQSYISKVSDGALQTLVDKQKESGFTSFNTSGIKTGASYSMGAISNAANGALAYIKAKYLGEVSKFEGYSHKDYVDEAATAVSVNGTEVTYDITTTGLTWSAFEIEIKVDKQGSDAVITGYTIKQNGSSVMPEQDYKELMSETAKDLNGKKLSEIEGYLSMNDGTNDDVINTGATYSNTLCYKSAAFALANYEKALAQFSQGGNS